MVLMREGVSVLKVEWSTVGSPDLDVHPLNLGLYMHLRIFEYSSNILVTSFDELDVVLRNLEELQVFP